MKKPLLLAVVGQTATGKTAFALKLAGQLMDKGYKKVVLLSADSKQVYQGLPILTGADIPDEFQPVSNDSAPYPFFQNETRSIELHGLSCVYGDEDWSVAHFQRLFKKLYENLGARTALIIVGGTGLYHQQLFDPAPTTAIKPNLKLRKKLYSQSLKTLQATLKKTWPARWQKMNHSDQNNPRRLVRAIEVSQTKKIKTNSSVQKPTAQFGLQLPPKILAAKIAERVDLRIEQSVMTEVQQFEMHHLEPTLQAKSALGYQEILQYLKGTLNLEELKQAWILAEVQYARRQNVWWKKRPGIAWLSPDQLTAKSVKYL
jgi:tRNA dimethylallyltransferase